MALLGPLETVNGMVMFGTSTALIFALMMRLIEQRMKAQPMGIDGMSHTQP